MKINWEERGLIFEKILNNHKINQIDKQWDCIHQFLVVKIVFGKPMF